LPAPGPKAEEHAENEPRRLVHRRANDPTEEENHGVEKEHAETKQGQEENDREQNVRHGLTVLPFGLTALTRLLRTRSTGERLIWLQPNVLAKLKALRGPGEGYSEVILRRGEG
jgi:hypothetical protein